MKEKDLKHYEELLLNEKSSIENTLDRMNENIENSQLVNNELSNYDNHPGDMGSETFDKEMYQNLKDNEIIQFKKIETALSKIKDGTYGKCVSCGKEIPSERLEILPDALECINCEKDNLLLELQNTRPIEEEVLGTPFFQDEMYIGEDWDAVAAYNQTDKKKMGLDWYDNNMYK